MDNAEMIFENALKNHYTMINEFKGVPDVKAERLEEAFNVKHCALSVKHRPFIKIF
jgi:tRNA wybutosine-synthesizing protein 1